MHEKTFRRACRPAGLNPYLCEMANIREHCSWIHEDRDEATAKAIDIARTIVEKVKHNRPLETIRIPVDQARAGHRRRHRRHPGRPGHRRRRRTGRAGREGAVHRRPHEPALRDLPHPRLLAVHPHAAHGGGLPAPATSRCHLERGREGRGLHRQLQGQDPQEGALRGRGPSAPAAATARRPCPRKTHPQRVRRRARQAHGHLRAVPAGGAQHAGASTAQNCTLFKGRRKGLAKDVCGKCKRPASRAPSTTTQKTPSSRRSRRHRGRHRLPALLHRPRAARGPQGLRRVRLRRGART